MELFSVKRYTTVTEKPHANENEILEKLLKKAQKRKKKFVEETPLKAVDVEDKQLKHEDAKSKLTKTNKLPVEISSNENDDGPTQSNDTGGFQVLGEDADGNKCQAKVDAVLPAWLAHPSIISTSIASTDGDDAIEKLPFLTSYTLQALKKMNVTRLFPVQTAVIPWILQAHAKPPPFRPRDVCVSAPTGSGKTLAFAIPVVQLLADRVERKVRALVVLPVAELAQQVFKVFKTLCEKTDLTVCLLSKQMPFPLEQQRLVDLYKGKHYSKVDIIVTTPGRLVEHLHATTGFCLRSLKFLIIDEADRIMDAVFQNWLYHVDAHVRTTTDQLLSGRSAPLSYLELLQSHTQPHKLLFSATLSQDPEKLQNLRLFQPKLFTSVLTNLQELRDKFAAAAEEQKTRARGEFIGKYTTPAELTEKYCITESRLKPLTLYSLINENAWTKFLCFTNSAESSGRLCFVLAQLCQKDLVVSELSSTLSAKERANVLSQFSRGHVNGLICSDALARGIDIPDVDIVISYDPPRHIKTYIHRIGRTARAGRPGTAITLLTQQELKMFNQTLAEVGKLVSQEITVSTTTEEQMAKSYSLALEALRRKLEKDKRQKVLLKERAREQSLIHKDPAKMTLMEKLQAQAFKQTHERAQRKEEQAQLGKGKKNAAAHTQSVVKPMKTKFKVKHGKFKIKK